jgi:hypothetical protein
MHVVSVFVVGKVDVRWRGFLVLSRICGSGKTQKMGNNT